MKRILLAGVSLAVMLTTANVRAESVNISTDTPLSSDVTFGEGESFTNSESALYGFNADDTAKHNITFDADSIGAEITGDGSKASGIATNGKLTINGGTFNVDNSGEDLYDKTSQLAGYRGVEVSGGEINLGKGSVMFTALTGNSEIDTANNLVLSGGTVNLNGGTLLTTSNDTLTSNLNLSGADVNVKDGLIVSKVTNLTDGSLNINGSLKVQQDKRDEGTNGVLNISGGNFAMTDSILNADKIAVNLSGSQVSDFNGDNIVNGDLNISSGTTTNHGNLTLNGKTTVNGATLERDFDKTTSVTLKDADVKNGGIIAADHMNINGTVTVAGTKNASNWRDGSDLVADKTMTINGGADVTVGEKGILTVGFNKDASTDEQKLDINGGNVTVENGGIIVAASNPKTGDKSAVNLNDGKLNLQSGSTLISAETNINGGEMTIAGNVTLLQNSYVDGFDGVRPAPANLMRDAAQPENGNFNINGGTVTLGSDANITNAGVDIKVQQGGILEVANDATVSDGLNLAGGTINSSAALTADVNQTSGVFNANDGSTLSSLSLNGGTFNANDGSTLTALAMENGNFNVNGDTTITDAAEVNGGTMNLGTSNLTATNGLTIADSAVLNTTVATDNDGNVINGKVTGKLEGKNDEGSTNAKVNLIIANGTDLSKAENLTIATDSSSQIALADNMMYDFSENADGSYKAAKADTSAKVQKLGVSGQSAAVLGAYADLASAGSSSGTAAGNQIIDAFTSALQTADGAGVAYAASQAENLMPMAGSIGNNVSTENSTQIMNVVNNELSGFSVEQGKASGDVFNKVNAWVKGLFNKADLERTSKHAGFTADNDGIAMGVDKQVSDDVKVGVGYSYINSDIKSGSKKTDVDTHTAILYGQYKPSDFYVNGIASYGWSDYDAKSSAFGVGLQSKYDVDTFGVQAIAGYDMGAFAPEAGLRYFNVKQDGYRDNAGQYVGKNSSDTLTAVAGVKYQDRIALDNGLNLKPSARVAATYDIVSDKGNSVVSLANGSAYVVDGHRLDRFGVEVGAGLAADINENVEVGVSYEGKFRNDYTDNTGLLEAKYKF